MFVASAIYGVLRGKGIRMAALVASRISLLVTGGAGDSDFLSMSAR
jgi:hypothetical protein